MRNRMLKAVCIAGSVMMLLSGCNIASAIEYSGVDEAKEAINNAQVLTIESDLEDANPAGNIKADGKVAGYMENSGLFNIKWTVSIDDQTWFYVKYAPDEPAVQNEEILSSTTYGYYDANDNCLGYAQKRVVDTPDGIGGYYLIFMDPDGNPKEYYATGEGDTLYDGEGNVIGTGKSSGGFFGSDCYQEITMVEGNEVQVDFQDKVAMALSLYNELYERYKEL